jgi:hypothetical protein
VAVGVIPVLAAGVVFSGCGGQSDLGGKTGDELAAGMERECGDSTRRTLDQDDLQERAFFLPPRFIEQATDVIGVTCPTGVVNPYAYLIRFRSAAALAAAVEAGRPQIDRERFCIAGAEAIMGDFKGYPDTCAGLRGKFRCPQPCQQRVRHHQLVAVSEPPALRGRGTR